MRWERYYNLFQFVVVKHPNIKYSPSVGLQATYGEDFILPAVPCEQYLPDVNVQAHRQAGRTSNWMVDKFQALDYTVHSLTKMHVV